VRDVGEPAGVTRHSSTALRNSAACPVGDLDPARHLAAVSVAVVWGLTFIAIKVGVAETSPLMLSALRFVFAAWRTLDAG
jgi:hypothetical protein